MDTLSFNQLISFRIKIQDFVTDYYALSPQKRLEASLRLKAELQILMGRLRVDCEQEKLINELKKTGFLE